VFLKWLLRPLGLLWRYSQRCWVIFCGNLFALLSYFHHCDLVHSFLLLLQPLR
jgi:hypothetical protein